MPVLKIGTAHGGIRGELAHHGVWPGDAFDDSQHIVIAKNSRIGELALRDNIVLAVLDNSRLMAEIELHRAQIVPRNGSIVLGDADRDG